MKQSITQKRDIETLANGVQEELVQVEGSFKAISNSGFKSFSMRQLFVVEWQMQRVDPKQIRKTTSKTYVEGESRR
jgi:hypothetical protein